MHFKLDKGPRSKGASTMSENQTTKTDHAGNSQPADFDAIIVGAGFAGLYMLHSLRELGLSVRVYEQGGGVGGTWRVIQAIR